MTQTLAERMKETNGAARGAGRNAFRHPPGNNGTQSAGGDCGDGHHLTDAGNAARLVPTAGHDLKHCHPWAKWLVWDGTRWKIDVTGEVQRRAKQMLKHRFLWVLDEMRRIREEDDEETATPKLKRLQDLQNWLIKSESAPRINAMLDLARSEPGVPILPEDMDRDAWSLNVGNGTVSLRTGELQAHRKEDLLTKICPTRYEPDGPCSNWLKFLAEIFDRNFDVVDYTQRLCGYCLTGEVSEHVLAVLHGCGANGKSVLLNVLLAVLGGDYATMSDFIQK